MLPRGWCLLDEAEPRTGAEQMARDAALRGLAVAIGAPILRLYRWAPACVSFGAHEAAARRFDAAHFSALGFDAVRRPTGGRAVLHADELTYGIAIPPALAPSPALLLAAVHTVIGAALKRLGIVVAAAPRRRAPAPDGGGICFDAAVGGELLANGAKLVGSAQHVGAGGTLQHGSILLADDQTRLHTLLRAPADAATSAAGTVTTVRACLGRSVAPDEMAAALLAAWAEATGTPERLAPAQLDAAAEPYRARYADPAWTWRR